MRPGTTGWVGARLRQAREARGIAAIALAEMLDVSRQAVSQYETGLQTPRPEIAEKIAAILNVPLHFFLKPISTGEADRVFYRSMSSATKTARIRAERRYEWLQEIVLYLREMVEFPAVHFPSCVFGDQPASISAEDIEQVATDARRFWNLGDGPISNVVWLLENNGAMLTAGELGADTLDAFSEWNREHDRPFIFLSTEKHSAARSRFDAAHELGHLLVHRNIDRACITRQVDYKLIEEQAHKFSAAFLLPQSSFAHDFYAPTLASFQVLKSKWRVSIGMMIMRSEHLGLISDEQARRLWINYARRGWRKGEPLDTTLPVEQPRVLRKAFEVVTSSGMRLKSDMETELCLSVQDIEQLAVLPRGFLADTGPRVRMLTPAEKSSSDRKTGGILSFPKPTI